MTAYHEEQHFHGALMTLLLIAMVFVVVVTVVAVVLSRPDDALLLAMAPLVVVLAASLISLSHLDIDVTEISRYLPLLDYGGWGVRLGPRGWAYSTGGDVGVQLRLRSGLPVLIGTKSPRELEAAIRTRMEARERTGSRSA